MLSVVTSFNHLKPPERDLCLASHMKSIKSLRHAGLTAVFTGQAVSWLAFQVNGINQTIKVLKKPKVKQSVCLVEDCSTI